jgi:hypothetical protein
MKTYFGFSTKGLRLAYRPSGLTPNILKLLQFNIAAEFVGRMEGFGDGLQYAAEGKPKTVYPYYDLEAVSKRYSAQSAFENVQVPLLQAISSWCFLSFLKKVTIPAGVGKVLVKVRRKKPLLPLISRCLF